MKGNQVYGNPVVLKYGQLRSNDFEHTLIKTLSFSVFILSLYAAVNNKNNNIYFS